MKFIFFLFIGVSIVSCQSSSTSTTEGLAKEIVKAYVSQDVNNMTALMGSKEDFEKIADLFSEAEQREIQIEEISRVQNQTQFKIEEYFARDTKFNASKSIDWKSLEFEKVKVEETDEMGVPYSVLFIKANADTIPVSIVAPSVMKVNNHWIILGSPEIVDFNSSN